MRRTCPAGGVGWHWEFDIVNRAISTTTLRLLTLAVAALALLVVPASQVTAQLGEDEEPTYTLRILAVEHDPAGSLAISVRVAGVTDLEPPRFTSLVDGITQRVDATPTRDVDTLAIVLAIDTSGSMAGALIEAARDAAISLIDQLNEGDEVAIVRFSNNVSLALDFTTDRAVARDVLNSLVAQGETALYDASAFTADLLSDISPARSNLVLLSDGEESGASAAARDASIQSLTDSGATAFAFGLGTSSDAEYLEAVAAGTGGEFWEVADDGALGSLFSSLGGRLGATDLVQVVTRPFAIGTHTADIFVTVLGERLEARAEFEVTNEGFVEISAVEGGEPGDPITVIATTLVDPAVLRLEATAGGQSLAFGSGTSLTIDPWRFGPGSLLIDVRANVSAGLAGSATFELVVPTLSPTLTIEQQPEATSVTVRQRVQGPGESTIVIRERNGSSRSIETVAREQRIVGIVASQPGPAPTAVRVHGPIGSPSQSAATNEQGSNEQAQRPADAGADQAPVDAGARRGSGSHRVRAGRRSDLAGLVCRLPDDGHRRTDHLHRDGDQDHDGRFVSRAKHEMNGEQDASDKR